MTTILLNGKAASRPSDFQEEFPWNRMHVEHAVKLIISSDTALVILEERNAHNRPRKEPAIKRYMEAMRAGEWVCNGETVIFGWDGQLLDGQNRLVASVNVDMPLRTWAIFGIDPMAFLSMGKPAVRTSSDDLSIQGHANAGTLAAAAAMVILDEAGSIESLGARVRHRKITEIVAKHPGLAESASFANSNPARMILPGRIVAFVHFQLVRAGKNPFDIGRFFEDIAVGANLAADDPVLMLRERVIASRASMNQKMTPANVLALLIIAWNYREAGRTVKRQGFNWRPGSGQPFPKIRGL